MSGTAQTVAKQAGLLMAASTLQKAISFVAFTLAARWLGAESIGLYFYILSISSMAGVWTDLGLTPVVIRAFATSEERGWAIVKRAMLAKALLIPLAALGALAYVLNTSQGSAVLPLLLLALLVMAEDTLSLLGYGILRGRQRLDRESLGMVIGQLISSGCLVAFVALGFGVWGAILALALGSAWHVVWSVYHVRKLGRPIAAALPPWKTLVREAMPFALAGLFVRVYSSVDAILLKEWRTIEEIGHYAVAYKLTYALQFVPLAFVAALYPALSAAHAKDEATELVHTSLGSWRFMALVSFPLAAALSGFAPRLVGLLYGEAFVPAATILAVLAWALPLLFLDFPVGSLLNATHRAKQKTIAMGVTMLVNAVANVLLIPRFGAVGAAMAALLGYVALLGVGVWYAREIFFSATAQSVFWRGVFVGGALWLLIRYALVYVPIVPALLLGALASVGLVVVCGLLSRKDLEQIRIYLTRRKNV